MSTTKHPNHAATLERVRPLVFRQPWGPWLAWAVWVVIALALVFLVPMIPVWLSGTTDALLNS